MESPMAREDSDVAERDEALDRIEAALRGLRFGTVTVVIQDGVVVQIERMEKLRLDTRRPGASGRTNALTIRFGVGCMSRPCP